MCWSFADCDVIIYMTADHVPKLSGYHADLRGTGFIPNIYYIHIHYNNRYSVSACTLCMLYLLTLYRVSTRPFDAGKMDLYCELDISS